MRDYLRNSDLKKGNGFCCRSSQSLSFFAFSLWKSKRRCSPPSLLWPRGSQGTRWKMLLSKNDAGVRLRARARAQTHTHTHTHTPPKDLLFYLSRWELKIGRDGNVLWQVHFCKHRTRKTKSALWSRQAGKSLSIDMATSREDSGKYTYFQSPHATVKV